jgi:hypothetical protein
MQTRKHMLPFHLMKRARGYFCMNRRKFIMEMTKEDCLVLDIMCKTCGFHRYINLRYSSAEELQQKLDRLI